MAWLVAAGVVSSDQSATGGADGLCADDSGGSEGCRDASAQEGREIYEQAVASGNWTYSQETHDFARRIGDCTDFCENAMRAAGMPSLENAENNGSVRTWQFASSSSFRPLGPNDTPRVGDIIVQGGHAGLFSGSYLNGFPQALQNGRRGGAKVITFGINPDGTGRNGLDPVKPIFYRRRLPISH